MWDAFTLEPLGERSLDGLVDMTEAYQKAAVALRRLAMVREAVRSTTPAEPPTGLTITWNSCSSGAHAVLRDVLNELLREGWKTVVKEAVERVHTEAYRAVSATRVAPARSVEDIDQ